MQISWVSFNNDYDQWQQDVQKRAYQRRDRARRLAMIGMWCGMALELIGFIMQVFFR